MTKMLQKGINDKAAKSQGIASPRAAARRGVFQKAQSVVLFCSGANEHSGVFHSGGAGWHLPSAGGLIFLSRLSSQRILEGLVSLGSSWNCFLWVFSSSFSPSNCFLIGFFLFLFLFGFYLFVSWIRITFTYTPFGLRLGVVRII